MAAILPNYEYDIFISYRQNDNRYDSWVTEFVENLQKELDATLKRPVSIYFDENPHDGLQETHVVDESLKKKLKCLIFIPILSQTYCDEQSFAWQHEFLPFIEMAKADELGMNITLANGNVGSRVLPVQIHELDAEDQSLLESIIGPLRSIPFIYKNAGVNRPLRVKDADLGDNQHKTNYRNQLNKVANAIKDLGSGILRKTKGSEAAPVNPVTAAPATKSPANKKLTIGIVALLLILSGYWGYRQFAQPNEITVATAATPDKTIAILPFANTKPDPDTDFLGFAVANQIIGDLDYNKNLIVRPASSVRKYAKQIIEPVKVADELKVNYLLTGTYLIQNNIIRLNIELLAANSETLIWREKIEVDYSDAFTLQDIVAKKVVDGLQTEFSQTDLSRINKNTSQNPLAFEYYLRAVSYPLSIEGHKLAIEMLNKSIELDSTYAPAYSHLGFRTRVLGFFNLGGPTVSREAEKYYLKALSLNNDLLAAQGDLAMLFVETNRIDEAITLVRKMVKTYPNNAMAYFALGYVYRFGGMMAEAVAAADKAIELDPKNPRFRRLGITYINVGDYQKAWAALELDKGSAYSLGYKVHILIKQGKNKEAVEICDRIINNTQDKLWILGSTALKAHILKQYEPGRKAMAELEKANISDGEAWYFWTSLYSLIEDHEGALRCLTRSINDGYFNYYFMQNDPFLDPVRDDPAIKELIFRAKSKHEAFKEKYF